MKPALFLVSLILLFILINEIQVRTDLIFKVQNYVIKITGRRRPQKNETISGEK